MSEYTPTTEEVRNGWVSCAFEGGAGMSDAAYEDAQWDDERAEAQFDRWLAAEKAKWQAEALRAHYRRVSRFMPPGLVDRATVLADLYDYADRIENGEQG